jgi:hypothetical protein
VPVGERGDERGPAAGRAVAEQRQDLGRHLRDRGVEVGGGSSAVCEVRVSAIAGYG